MLARLLRPSLAPNPRQSNLARGLNLIARQLPIRPLAVGLLGTRLLHSSHTLLATPPPVGYNDETSPRPPTLEEFHGVASATVDALQEVFDELADGEPQHQLEVECDGDVLTISIGEVGVGPTFVLNKQTPSRQLWLSSPVSGPLRFDFCSMRAAWHGSRDGMNLLDTLASDFESLLDGEEMAARLEAVAEAIGERSVPSRCFGPGAHEK